MKANLFLKVFIVLGFIFFIMNIYSQQFELCGRWDSEEVLDGEYIIMNNVWGGDDGVGDQCIIIDSTSFIVDTSSHNSGGVASYPCIYKGCHWGHCTENSDMPLKIIDVESAPFIWAVSTEAGGTWNTAFESWFSINGADDPAGGGELMIWIDYNGGASPGGSMKGTVEIGGHYWSVYFAEWNWNYIAYKISEPVDSVNLDLVDFIKDSYDRGYLDSAWYLDNMEAGFEIWRDGQGLGTYYFEASVVAGESPINTNNINESELDINFVSYAPEKIIVSYNLPVSGNVNLCLYDMLGKKVITLKNEYQNAGYYNIEYYTSNLNQGLYICRLQIKNYTITKKIFIR